MRYINLVLVAVLLGMQACTAPVQTGVPQKQKTLADFPEAFYQSAKENNEPVYSVNTTESEVEILVYRGGTFARMGHNHVVTSRDVHGYVLLSETSDILKADLYVLLDSLVIDEAEKRVKAGFTSSVSEKDIAGTKRNMLEKVLEAQSYPHVFIHVEAENMNRYQVVTVDITLHGTTRNYVVPVELINNNDRLSASGRMVLRQTDFGMTPFSVLGGALRVLDDVILNFTIHAKRIK